MCPVCMQACVSNRNSAWQSFTWRKGHCLCNKKKVIRFPLLVGHSGEALKQCLVLLRNCYGAQGLSTFVPSLSPILSCHKRGVLEYAAGVEKIVEFSASWKKNRSGWLACTIFCVVAMGDKEAGICFPDQVRINCHAAAGIQTKKYFSFIEAYSLNYLG